MDEIMRGMQGTNDKASIARLRPLPLWMGVGMVGPIQMDNRSQSPNTPRFRQTTAGIVTAQVIAFYTPKNFRRKMTLFPPSQPGKVIKFCRPAKRSA